MTIPLVCKCGSDKWRFDNRHIPMLRTCRTCGDSAQVVTHSDQILSHLQSGLTLTQAEATRLFGCFRLAARVYDLRQAGHDIRAIDERNDSSGTHARYFLQQQGEAA